MHHRFSEKGLLISGCNLIDVVEDDEGADESVDPDPVIPTVGAN
jgi:hypothetical protein